MCSLTLMLSACGSKAVAQSDVEEQVKDQLTKTVGQTPDKIECPGDLKAEVGTTMRCTLSAGGDSIGLTVEVTSVEGDNVKFGIEVDQQ